MTGSIALHGGGEFLPGDEGFLAALLALVPKSTRPIRIAVVPTAAARGRPDLAAANGIAAFERVAGDNGRQVAIESVRVVDEASAADPALADVLGRADLIHLPGGDPDLIPAIMSGSAAWAGVLRALAGGAILAGASAGAMALAGWTWTPDGGVPGLGLLPGLIVMPHATAASWEQARARFGASVPAGLAAIGLAERTGVIMPPFGPWRVVGEGEVRWLPSGQREPRIARDGETIEH
jgi:cyanophycinase-like exopeptidase